MDSSCGPVDMATVHSKTEVSSSTALADALRSKRGEILFLCILFQCCSAEGLDIKQNTPWELKDASSTCTTTNVKSINITDTSLIITFKVKGRAKELIMLIASGNKTRIRRLSASKLSDTNNIFENVRDLKPGGNYSFEIQCISISGKIKKSWTEVRTLDQPPVTVTSSVVNTQGRNDLLSEIMHGSIPEKTKKPQVANISYTTNTPKRTYHSSKIIPNPTTEAPDDKSTKVWLHVKISTYLIIIIATFSLVGSVLLAFVLWKKSICFRRGESRMTRHTYLTVQT